MANPRLEAGETGIGAPSLRASHLNQRVPLLVIKTGDRDPAVNAFAAVSPMRRGAAMGRAIAGSLPFAPVHRPFENGLATEKDARFALRGVDALALARHRAVVERAEQRLREAISAHPIEEGIAPASGHRGLRQTRHVIRSRERGGDRADSPQTSVGPIAPHARLLHIDDVGTYFALNVIAEPQTVKHAGRETLRDNVGNGDQALRDLEALRVANVERDAALAGILVVVLPAHIRSR